MNQPPLIIALVKSLPDVLRTIPMNVSESEDVDPIIILFIHF